MVKQFIRDKILDRKALRTEVAAGLAITFIVWVCIQVSGIISTVNAAEEAHAKINGEISDIKTDLKANCEADAEREAKHEEEIKEINNNFTGVQDRLTVLETTVSTNFTNMNKQVDRILDKLDKMED